jgi:hypothetical protein
VEFLLDSLVDLADSGLGRVLLFIAAVLAIPTTLVAMWRWAVFWWYGRQHRKALARLTSYVWPKRQLTRDEQIDAALDILNDASHYLSPQTAAMLRGVARQSQDGKVTRADIERDPILFSALRTALERMFVDGIG